MQQEDDPNTTPIEWAIYSIGIDRPASILGAKAGKMEVRVTKIIVQIGTTTGGWPHDKVIVDYGENRSTPGQHIHIGGPPLPDGPTIYKADGWTDNAPVGSPTARGGVFLQQRPQPPTPYSEWWDGWQQSSNFKIEMNNPQPGATLQNAINDGVITNDDITTGVNLPFPDIDLSKFGLPGEGAEIEADYYIDLNNPNYNTDIRDLRHNNHGWEIVDNTDGSKTLVQPMKPIGLFGKVVDQSLIPGGDCLYDINGDGYTVIYIPESNTMDINIRIYNLRIMPKIKKGNEEDITRAIIVSRDKGQNLYDGADYEGKVELYPGLYWGADEERNSNVGIDIRGEICPNDFPAGRDAFYDFVWDDTTQKMTIRRINYATLSDTVFYTMGEESGALSLLSENDIIISTPGIGFDIEDPGDPQSIFRGLVYSKRNVILQEDLLLRGAIVAKEGIDFVDQSVLWPGLSEMGDGFDIALCYENPFESSDGTRSFIHGTLEPTRGGGTGRIQVIAWENIGGYKQIQQTF
jgi:hypothetical protein